MTQTTKDAEALAANILRDHFPYEFVNMEREKSLIAKSIQSALTAAYERGKADVVPSGDARELAVKFCQWAKPDCYGDLDIDDVIAFVATVQSAARAEGERIGFERAVPDGWQLVPKEPTTPMRDAFDKDQQNGFIHTPCFVRLWKAMLAAAPSSASKLKGTI